MSTSFPGSEDPEPGDEVELISHGMFLKSCFSIFMSTGEGSLMFESEKTAIAPPPPSSTIIEIGINYFLANFIS